MAFLQAIKVHQDTYHCMVILLEVAIPESDAIHQKNLRKIVVKEG